MYNFIKKAVSLISAVVIVFSLVSCSPKSKDPSDIVGTWKYEMNGNHRDVVTEVIVDERVYVDIYYVFNADGTGETHDSLTKTPHEFTYEFTGDKIIMTEGGETFEVECALVGDSLTITEMGESVEFLRQ